MKMASETVKWKGEQPFSNTNFLATVTVDMFLKGAEQNQTTHP